MDHFQRRLLLRAPPSAVYTALTTPAGLRAWWTSTCEVGRRVGERAIFRFGESVKVMRIEYLEPARELRWRCIEAQLVHPSVTRPDEWVGTQLVFRLAPRGGGGTELAFEHLGLTAALQCHAICVQAWDYYLESLQDVLAGGPGTAYRDPIATLIAHLATTPETTA